MAYYKLGDKKRSFALWDKVAVRDSISADGYNSVGLKEDGTVVVAGSNDYGQCDVSGWRDIIAIAFRRLPYRRIESRRHRGGCGSE